MRLLVDEPYLELAFLLLTVIRLFFCQDIHFLFCFSNHSSVSTWIVATIGACRTGGGGGRACQYVGKRGGHTSQLACGEAPRSSTGRRALGD
jgi:hypothetical protein